MKNITNSTVKKPKVTRHFSEDITFSNKINWEAIPNKTENLTIINLFSELKKHVHPSVDWIKFSNKNDREKAIEAAYTLLKFEHWSQVVVFQKDKERVNSNLDEFNQLEKNKNSSYFVFKNSSDDLQSFVTNLKIYYDINIVLIFDVSIFLKDNCTQEEITFFHNNLIEISNYLSIKIIVFVDHETHESRVIN